MNYLATRFAPAAAAALIAVGFGWPSDAAGASGNPQRGLEKSQVCQSCHGETGNESLQPSYPKLAGQHADYLRHSLKSYRDGGRQNAVMSGIAAGLSDQDIADLAAWYASQEGLEDLSID